MMGINEVDASKDYVIRITYKSSATGGPSHLHQWDGSAYHVIGTYTRDSLWHTATFISKAFWAYDYTGAGDTWGMDELSDFDAHPQHPQLDDDSDGIGHEKGSMNGDGGVAQYVYL